MSKKLEKTKIFLFQKKKENTERHLLLKKKWYRNFIGGKQKLIFLSLEGKTT